MAITYYDNKSPYAFHSDVPAWDPDQTFPETEYVNAHFRIRCPTYYAKGFENHLDRDAFYADAGAALLSAGFHEARTEKRASWWPSFAKGKAALYIHPNDVSGIVRKSDVKRIAEALSAGSDFSLEYVDLYETAYDMDDSAYFQYLSGRKQEILVAICEAAQTKRRTSYFRAAELSASLSGRFRLRRAGMRDESTSGGYGPTAEYIYTVIQEAVKSGYLASFVKTDVCKYADCLETEALYVRTLNKTERRKAKVKIPT